MSEWMTAPHIMPIFVVKGQDVLAVETIEAYRDLCVKYSLTAQADQVDLAIAEMVAWQGENQDRVRLPEHRHVPAGARPAVEFTRLLDNPFVPTAARDLIHKAFRILGYLNRQTGKDLHWVINPHDLDLLCMHKPANPAGDLIQQWPPSETSPDVRMTLLGIEVIRTQEVPVGSLSLVIDGG